MNEKQKTNLQKLIIVIMSAALAFCFVLINRLENEIDQLENSLNSQYHMLTTQVESIYTSVDQMLKEEASLLSNVTAEHGELNVDDHTIDVTVSLVPKLISDDMKVQLSINGRTTELSRNGSTFTGMIPVNIYNKDEQLLMTIETAAGTQTQFLPEVQTEYLWEGRLPSLYHCEISGERGLSEGKYTITGELDINCSPIEDTPNVHFEKFVLVTELNGKEIDREDISQDVLNYQTYPHGVYFRHDYQMECEAAEGDELGIYLEATDSLGYLHRRLIHHWKQQNGNVAEAVDASEYIYAPDGTPVF